MPFEETGHSYSEGDDEHDTPVDFFRPFHRAVGGFELDPAASSTSNLAARNVTEDEDGLARDWWGDVWLNPPYSGVSDWLEYGRRQYQAGNCDSIVALVYARTGTQWFHNHAVTADLMCLVEGRLTFGDGEYSAPAPSMVLIWGPPAHDDTLREHLVDDVGLVVELPSDSDDRQGILRSYV
jgi:phage N-6-adenine-methyltransferase